LHFYLFCLFLLRAVCAQIFCRAQPPVRSGRTHKISRFCFYFFIPVFSGWLATQSELGGIQ
jgi:hypothetical protein